MNRAAPHGAASVGGDVILPFARSKLLYLRGENAAH